MPFAETLENGEYFALGEKGSHAGQEGDDALDVERNTIAHRFRQREVHPSVGAETSCETLEGKTGFVPDHSLE